MADGRIVKLVFLMVESADGRAPPRKAVVPLVEGCDFENFLHRLRRRLGVADTVTPTISDTATGAVDSIDRLLEVDEGTTLHVQVPFVPQEYALSSPSPTVGASGTSSAVTPSPASQVRGATHRASVVSPPGSACSNGADASGGAHEHRLDVPTASLGGDLEDDDKYERRRSAMSIVRIRRTVGGLFCLVCIGFAAYEAFA